MPFAQVIPRSFNVNGVRMFAPPQPGVYGISNAREWIFIGEAENIQEALLEHIGRRGAELMQRTPTGFVFEVCMGELRAGRRDRLVGEYGPVCNREFASGRR